MKFKLSVRNKLTGEWASNVVDASNEHDARDEASSALVQVMSVRYVGAGQASAVSQKTLPAPRYVATRTLRMRHEQALMDAATGITRDGAYQCPDCGQWTLTAFQRRRGYHCDACTREADPLGWARDVSTPHHCCD